MDNATKTNIRRRVDHILAAKQRDAEADTSALEREIDQLVYGLYDLTPEEIAIVEKVQELTDTPVLQNAD